MVGKAEIEKESLDIPTTISIIVLLVTVAGSSSMMAYYWLIPGSLYFSDPSDIVSSAFSVSKYDVIFVFYFLIYFIFIAYIKEFKKEILILSFIFKLLMIGVFFVSLAFVVGFFWGFKYLLFGWFAMLFSAPLSLIHSFEADRIEGKFRENLRENLVKLTLSLFFFNFSGANINIIYSLVDDDYIIKNGMSICDEKGCRPGIVVSPFVKYTGVRYLYDQQIHFVKTDSIISYTVNPNLDFLNTFRF